MRSSLNVILVCVLLASCNPGLSTGPDIYVDFEMIDTPTAELSPMAKPLMNGVYEVVQGTEVLGNVMVGKWIGNRWCLYSERDVIFCVSAGGFVTDSIRLWGYERTVRSGSGTRITFTVSTDDGAKELIAAQRPASLRFTGVTESGLKIELRRRRDDTSSTSFARLAHRGGARNSERLGISENSVAMIHYAPLMGATGVEIDVQRTKDNQIIVFHDDSFSPRTVQGAYLLGRVGNFDYEQIRTLGKLINGEPIPTLREVLAAVMEEKALSLVWMDVKEPGEVSQVVTIQEEMLAAARTNGRNDLEILLGIPSQEVLDAWVPFSARSDALCELELSTATAYSGIKVWAPTWTRGDVTPENIASAHQSSKRVYTWTVDVREGMLDYMQKNVDGILTNYPSLVTALHGSE